MKDNGQLEVLARGVCVKDEKLLLCQTKGDTNTYLPGGHVEFMEKVPDGLCREIKEETGMDAMVMHFLGAVEHTFIQESKRHCEVNLIFEIDIPEIDVSRDPASCEGYIQFLWAAISGLREAKLEPAVLCDLLPVWLKHRDVPERWSSSYD